MGTSITDRALREIVTSVGSRVPESGGALMGPRATSLVTRFVFDPDADTTAASYVPSRALQTEVQRLERNNPSLVFKGILHSHPGGMNHPSGMDERSFNDYLSENVGLAALHAVIATFHDSRLDAHELWASPLRLSFFTATRSGGRAHVRPDRPRVLPIESLSERLARAGLTLAEVVENAADEVGLFTAEVRKGERVEALITFSEDFPVSPPVIYRRLSGSSELAPAPLTWDLLATDALRFEGLVSCLEGSSRVPDTPLPTQAIESSASSSVVGPRARALSAVVHTAGLGFRILADILGKKPRSDLFARSTGILDRNLQNQRVLIVGCGSVGSTLALQLARAGVTKFILIDPEEVEPSNVGRSTFSVGDIGSSKCQALSGNLRRINTSIDCQTISGSVQEVPTDQIISLLNSTALVIGACDDPRAQSELAHISYQLNVPALFIGVYERATGGEIVASLPSFACYNCAVRRRLEVDAPGQGPRRVDYGTGRLTAEPGLYADISVISDFAAKLALSLLGQLPANSPLRAFKESLAEQGRTFILIGLSPAFMFFDEPVALGDAPAQFALQSMWMSVSKDASCSTCGPERGGLRELHTPSASELAEEFRQNENPVGGGS